MKRYKSDAMIDDAIFSKIQPALASAPTSPAHQFDADSGVASGLTSCLAMCSAFA